MKAGASRTEAITGYLDNFLAGAGLAPNDIETVFLTGGTSLLRTLRGEIARPFTAERLRDGGEFTSVAEGLALSAPLFFPALHGA